MTKEKQIDLGLKSPFTSKSEERRKRVQMSDFIGRVYDAITLIVDTDPRSPEWKGYFGEGMVSQASGLSRSIVRSCLKVLENDGKIYKPTGSNGSYKVRG